MSSDVQSIISRHDPGGWPQTLAYRPKADLPFDPFQVPPKASLLFDATVYIDQLKGQLPRPIVDLVASRTILHGAPALAELAVTIGVLDPADRRTQAIPKQDRRKFLNDALLFLQAADAGAVMMSRNSRDLDLLLQIKPDVGVLLYDKS